MTYIIDAFTCFILFGFLALLATEANQFALAAVLMCITILSVLALIDSLRYY